MVTTLTSEGGPQRGRPAWHAASRSATRLPTSPSWRSPVNRCGSGTVSVNERLSCTSTPRATPAAPPLAKGTDGQQKHPSKPNAAVSSATAVSAPVTTAATAPSQGMISVQSDPAGAAIILDGKDTGKKTPAQIAAAPGPHNIVLKQAGYADGTASANVDGGGRTASVSQTLVKLSEAKEIKPIGGLKKIFGGASETMGRIRIETKPKGVKVTVGTQVVSKPTPVEFDLAPGNYQITLEADGYAPLQTTVEISAGKKLQLTETLTKK